MKYIATLPLMLAALSATAQNEVTVDRFNLAGPFAVSKPFQTDTVNINGKKWSQWSFLDIVSHDAPPLPQLLLTLFCPLPMVRRA